MASNPQFWELLGLSFQLVPFFMLKIHVPVDITEELSPKVRMILISFEKNIREILDSCGEQ